MRKLKQKGGGIKELLYDNIAIFIVLVLIVVVGFSMARQNIDMGNKVIEEQEKIIDVMKWGEILNDKKT